MSWITEQDPKLVGGRYGATTPHIFCDEPHMVREPTDENGIRGRLRLTHCHDGMPVKGTDPTHRTMDDAFRISGDAAEKIKAAAKKQGVTRRVLAKHCSRAYTTLMRGLSGGASFQQVDVDKINELLGLNISLLTD